MMTKVNVITFTSLVVHWKVLLLWKLSLLASFKAWLSDSLFLLRLERLNLRFEAPPIDSVSLEATHNVNQLPSGEVSL